MKLQLLNINDFIKKTNAKEVTSRRIFTKGQSLDENGLFSEEIFGPLGSRERKRRFGYINLKKKVIHPAAYDILLSSSSIIKKIVSKKALFKLSEDGKLIQVKDTEKDGIYVTNLPTFIKYFDKIDITKLIDTKEEKEDYLKFLKNNKNLILIDKILVLPAGYRDIIISDKTHKILIMSSDLSQMYISLLQYVSALIAPDNPYTSDDLEDSIIIQIQKTVNDIYQWIENQLKGKVGLIRHGMISKTVDYSARLPVTGDPTLNIGYVGVPWFILIKLFETFVIHHLLKEERTVLEVLTQNTGDINIDTIKDIINNIYQTQGSTLTQDAKEQLIRIVKEVVADKVILYKRDPVENRDSWLCANIRVDTDSVSLKLSPLDLPRTGGDFDGDTYAIFALMTKEAVEEAKNKLHPVHSKSVWTKVNTLDEGPYSISNESTAFIYHATKGEKIS